MKCPRCDYSAEHLGNLMDHLSARHIDLFNHLMDSADAFDPQRKMHWEMCFGKLGMTQENLDELSILVSLNR